MNTQNKFWQRITLALVSGLFLTGPVSAAKDDDDAAAKASENTKTKQAQAVSKGVFDKITKAQEMIDAEDNRGALKILEGMLKSGKLTDYEKTNVLNYVGFVRYSTDDIDGALAAYKQLLAIPELEPQTKKATIYTMAQLNTMEEKYTDAIRLMEQWFVLETNPAPQPFILYAQNLYQVNRYAEMVKPIESAIAVAKKRETTVKEDWYVLLNFAYFQQENYEMVRDIQKILLVNWPKKRYWISLAGAFTELGQDGGLLTAYDAAHTQGMLEKESELVTMAQLYMSNEVPYKAATLLESEMESGRVSKNAKNYRLLSQALQLSMEDKRAIPALKEAARLSDDGELNLRLGNSHLNLSQYSECVAAVQEGIKKGGIKSPDNAQISLGMCLYNEKKYRDAIRAFTKAGKVQRSAKVSKQWIRVIESDIARNEQIRLAETAARKRQEELAKRRQSSERI
jgi:tetratricopeptide (TPR) repeat protein